MTQNSKIPAGTGTSSNGSDDQRLPSNSSLKPDRKPVLFSTDGRQVNPGGGLARLLDMMIDACMNGTNPHMCGEWCADLPAGICRLRNIYALDIETVNGKPTSYVLRSPVCRDWGKAMTIPPEIRFDVVAWRITAGLMAANHQC